MKNRRVIWFILTLLLCGFWNLPATAQQQVERSYWSYDTGHFKNTTGNKWIEKSNKDTFHFVEQDRTAKYVQLYDKSRACIVRLFDDRCLAKFGEGKFTNIHDGKWVPQDVKPGMRHVFRQGETVYAVALSPDSKLAATGSGQAGKACHIRLWDTVSGKEVHCFVGHKSIVVSLDFSPDGKYLLSASSDMTVRLWDLAERKELKVLLGHVEGKADSYVFATFTPKGDRALSASWDGSLRQWDVPGGKHLLRYGEETAWGSVAASYDGKLVVAGGWRTLVQFELESGKELRRIAFPENRAWPLAFLPDGNSFVVLHTTDNDPAAARLRQYATKQGKLLRELAVPGWVCLAKDGRRYLTADAANNVLLYDWASGKELAKFAGHTNTIHQALALSRDGQWALSGSIDGTARLWRLPAAAP